MSGWFGQSWGAPCCDPEEHVPTPIGETCLKCSEPIRADDQGIAMPLVSLGGVTTIYYHVDCYLQKILPHTFACVRCRGRNINEHHEGCTHRREGGECDCYASWAPGVPTS